MKTLTCIVTAIFMAGRIDASPVLNSSEVIEAQISQSNLIVIGSLSSIDQIAFYDGLNLIGKTPEEAKKSRPSKAKVTAMYCAKLKVDRVLHTDFQDKTLGELSILWNGVYNFSGNQIDSLRYAFCPPVSVSAFQSKTRIWFLKVEHGFCYPVSDHSIDHLPNILDFVKTGRSIDLDIKNLERHLSQYDEDDPFYDKDDAASLKDELKELKKLRSTVESEDRK